MICILHDSSKLFTLILNKWLHLQPNDMFCGKPRIYCCMWAMALCSIWTVLLCARPITTWCKNNDATMTGLPLHPIGFVFDKTKTERWYAAQKASIYIKKLLRSKYSTYAYSYFDRMYKQSTCTNITGSFSSNLFTQNTANTSSYLGSHRCRTWT